MENGYPKVPGYKVDGTSKQAAIKETPRAKVLRVQVLGLYDSGQQLTADECAVVLAETVLSIRPRVSELVAQGTLEDSGKKRRNASGHNAVVWRRRKELNQPELFAV